MPTIKNTKLPALPDSVVRAPKVNRTPKSFPPRLQEPSVKVNLRDKTARFLKNA